MVEPESFLAILGRCLFVDFDYFNKVQSEVIDDVYHSDRYRDAGAKLKANSRIDHFISIEELQSVI